MIVTLGQLCPQYVKNQTNQTNKQTKNLALLYYKLLRQMNEVTFFFNLFFNGEGFVEKLNLDQKGLLL